MSLKLQDYSELLVTLYEFTQENRYEEASELLNSVISEVTTTLESVYMDTIALQKEYQDSDQDRAADSDSDPNIVRMRNFARENSVLMQMVSRQRRRGEYEAGDLVSMLQCGAAALEDLILSD